jgi:hypothetical protein
MTARSVHSGLRWLALLAVLSLPGMVPSAAQTMYLKLKPGLKLRSVEQVDVDCSAYRREADGSWTVLRFNTISLNGKIGRQVIPEDDPEIAKLTDGSRLETRLNLHCQRRGNVDRPAPQTERK